MFNLFALSLCFIVNTTTDDEDAGTRDSRLVQSLIYNFETCYQNLQVSQLKSRVQSRIPSIYQLAPKESGPQSDGDSEHTIPILPNLNQEYASIGGIVTHQYVQCDIFPVKVSQASMQKALLGNTTDECKINSFLRIQPPRDRECFSKALAGDGPFPTAEMIDLLEDHNIHELPTADNIKSLVLFVATTEFVTKPFLCLSSMRDGMGHL